MTILEQALAKTAIIFQISETHAVKKEMIRQITIPEEKENAGRRNMLEVKGDIPPRAGTCKYIDHGEHSFDSCHSLYK